jgi:hypothetical protein
LSLNCEEVLGRRYPSSLSYPLRRPPRPSKTTSVILSVAYRFATPSPELTSKEMKVPLLPINAN